MKPQPSSNGPISEWPHHLLRRPLASSRGSGLTCVHSWSRKLSGTLDVSACEQSLAIRCSANGWPGVATAAPIGLTSRIFRRSGQRRLQKSALPATAKGRTGFYLCSRTPVARPPGLNPLCLYEVIAFASVVPIRRNKAISDQGVWKSGENLKGASGVLLSSFAGDDV